MLIGTLSNKIGVSWWAFLPAMFISFWGLLYYNEESIKDKINRLDKEIKEAEIELMEHGNELEASRSLFMNKKPWEKEVSKKLAFVDVDYYLLNDYLLKNEHLLESTTPAVYWKKQKKQLKKLRRIMKPLIKHPNYNKKYIKRRAWNKGKKLSKQHKLKISKGMKLMWKKRK